MTIWDWMKQVTYIKEPWSSFTDEDKESFNRFMIHKIISMYEPYIELANYLQKFWALTPEQIYVIYCEYLPNQKIYAKYIKTSNKKHNSELLEVLSDHFKVSTREIKQYLQILKEQEVKQILSGRGMSEDEINKLLDNEKPTKSPKPTTGIQSTGD
jgi:hypothetical protein